MDVKLTRAEQAMLKMLQLGLDRRVVSALLQLEDYDRDHIRYLEGPIVVSTRGMAWADALPQWLVCAIWQDRLEQIILEHKENRVGKLGTLSEVAALLMLESLVAPLGHEWTKVYLCACKTVYTKHRGEFPSDLGEDTPELTDYERDRFRDRIRYDIRQKVMQAAPEMPDTRKAAARQYALDL